MELLLSSTGRLSRRVFVACAVGLVAVGAAYDRLAPQGLYRWTALVVHCALLFSAACIVSKRFHDRGKAGWWAFLPVFAVIAVWPAPRTAWAMAPGVVLLWAFVELALMPGEPGANRFGPPQPASRPSAT